MTQNNRMVEKYVIAMTLRGVQKMYNLTLHLLSILPLSTESFLKKLCLFILYNMNKNEG